MTFKKNITCAERIKFVRDVIEACIDGDNILYGAYDAAFWSMVLYYFCPDCDVLSKGVDEINSYTFSAQFREELNKNPEANRVIYSLMDACDMAFEDARKDIAAKRAADNSPMMALVNIIGDVVKEIAPAFDDEHITQLIKDVKFKEAK